MNTLNRSKLQNRLVPFLCLLIIQVFSCVGDGIGLDEFGDTLDSLAIPTNSIPLNPTLESIQANIFDSICAVKCHKSPRPKKGLNLAQGEAFDHLVDVPSDEKPELMLVAPYDSENSYIIWKLEGRDGISGKQMPLNLNPLGDEEIEVIRTWIDEGALP